MAEVARMQRNARIVVAVELAVLVAEVCVWGSWLFLVVGLVVWFATVGLLGRRIQVLMGRKH